MARLSFSEALNPYLQNTANILSGSILNNKELERQEFEKEKSRREQASVLSQLLGGGYSNKVQPSQQIGTYAPQEEGFSPQRQGSLISRLTPENYDRYKELTKKPEKKQQKTVTIDGNVYLESPEYENVPTGDPLFSAPKKQEEPKKVWIKDERFGDKMKKLMGYENPEADVNDPQTRVVNDKKYTITDYAVNDIWEKKTNQDGKDRFTLKDEIKKSLGDYYKEQQKLLAITNAGFGNNKDKDDIAFRDKLATHNKVYSEAVKNTMSTTARQWYDGLYNYQDDNKKTGNPDPEDYWNVLKKDYVDGKLGKDPSKEDDYEDADFQVLTENFKAIYGFDPTQVYGY